MFSLIFPLEESQSPGIPLLKIHNQINSVAKPYNKSTPKKQKFTVRLCFSTRDSENTDIIINVILIICKFVFMVD